LSGFESLSCPCEPMRLLYSCTEIFGEVLNESESAKGLVMATATTSSKAEKLERQLETAKAELQKLEAKVAEAVKQRRQSYDRVDELRRAIHTQQIKDLANVEGAVCIGTVGSTPKLDNLTGTVIKVGRSYAVVRFENGENWKIPFSEVGKVEDMAKRPREFASFKL